MHHLVQIEDEMFSFDFIKIRKISDADVFTDITTSSFESTVTQKFNYIRQFKLTPPIKS